MLDIFVDAFVYEPTNTITSNNRTRQILTYIHKPPDKILHPYLHAFMDHSSPAVVDCCLVLGNDLPVCIGCGEGEHSFLKAEGICRCNKCEKFYVVSARLLKKMMKKQQTKQNNTVTIVSYRKYPSNLNRSMVK
jgi:hypothetical protein